jgi:putative endonuclease
VHENAYVYILTNKHNQVLYIGVTSDLTKRIWEHKSKLVKGFTKKYNCEKLVFYQDCGGIEQAIVREKALKGGPRRRKVALIEAMNPEWRDLSMEIYG